MSNIAEETEVDESLTLQSVAAEIQGLVYSILELEDDDEVDEYENLADIGFSSSSIVLFIDEINRAFDLDLAAHVVFDYTNMAEISEYVFELLGEEQDVDLDEENTFELRRDPERKRAEAEAPVRPEIERCALDEVLERLAAKDIDVDEALFLINEASV